MTVRYTPESGEAAHEAMATLHTIQRHTAGCRQCQLDAELCSTRQTYQDTFSMEFDRWLRSAQQPRLATA